MNLKEAYKNYKTSFSSKAKVHKPVSFEMFKKELAKAKPLHANNKCSSGNNPVFVQQRGYAIGGKRGNYVPRVCVIKKSNKDYDVKEV